MKLTMKLLLYSCFLLIIWENKTYCQVKLTLEKAVDIAMENSPDIRRTRLDLERNEELLKAQQAATKSNFRLTINPFSYQSDLTFNRFLSAWSASETKESTGTFTISQPIKWLGGTFALIDRFTWQDSYSDYQDVRNKNYNNNLYLNYSQPIFTYNIIKLQLRELELSLEKTALTYAIQELQIERFVAQTFYQVYKTMLNLQITKEELENQQKSYTIIKNKVEADLAAKEELFQAELNLLSSQSSVQNAIVTLENAYDELKQLLGLPLTEPIAIDADTSFQSVMIDLNKAITSGLESRRELRQRQIDIENAQIDMVRTSAQNEFKGTINLTYGLTGANEQLDNIYKNPTKNQSLGLSLEIPLWDWGEKKSRIKAAEATIKRQKLSYDDETVAIKMEIRQTVRQLRNLELQVRLARQNVKNAQLTYEINIERYEYGDLTSMDLSLYQNQLSQKKTDLISALVEYKLALLDLKIQTLWDFEKDEPVLKKQNF